MTDHPFPNTILAHNPVPKCACNMDHNEQHQQLRTPNMRCQKADEERIFDRTPSTTDEI